MSHATPTRIVYFGTDAFSVPPLIRLIADGWNIIAVVTKPDSPTGRGRKITAPAVKRLAEASNIPVLQPNSLKDITTQLKDLKADLGIVVAYGKIIPQSVLDLFPLGLLNIHASLLPRFRGASPIESALLEGDSETGITLMRIDAGLDTGPTYDTARLQLDGTENREQLYEQLAEMGAELLAAQLPAIVSGQVVPLPQDNAQATEVGRINKSDGIIDWARPAEIIERQIRAYLGWPGSRTTIAGTDAAITKAHLSRDAGSPGKAFVKDGQLGVYAGSGSIIIDEIKPAGSRTMPARDFLAGHQITD